jgi:hypothetical protein
LSRYADRIDVLKNPMLRVGRPVVVLFDLTDGSQVALNSADATEWRARDPGRYSLTAAAEMKPQLSEPKTTGQVINLVAATGAQLGGFWLLDAISGNKYIVFSPDFIEWQNRDLRYQPSSSSP